MDERLPPVMSYYGSKWTIAPKYPSPVHDTIIEPFAGSATYSLLHYRKNVILYDKFDKVIGVWDYLIRSSPAEILALPLLEPGQRVSDLPVCQEARWLIGWWVNGAVDRPRETLSKNALKRPNAPCFWSAACRERIARTVNHIKHWKAYVADYSDVPIQRCTWFVDPPYQRMGKYYKHGSAAIGYPHLRDWCLQLPGQVMVCENEGADWLPFVSFATARSAKKGYVSKEVIYMDDDEPEPNIEEWDDHWNEPEPCPECGKEDRQCPVCS